MRFLATMGMMLMVAGCATAPGGAGDQVQYSGALRGDPSNQGPANGNTGRVLHVVLPMPNLPEQVIGDEVFPTLRGGAG